ncbi:hypothetical protein OH77DRAFT_152075 [Trametes cingulata]|nr:hypothetical protein OH77DRAFT_152075 [Trametes cingulata]
MCVCLSTGTGLPMCVGRNTGTNHSQQPVHQADLSDDAGGHGTRTPPSPAPSRTRMDGLRARARLCEARPQAAGILEPPRSPASPCSATPPTVLRGVQRSRNRACCAPPSVRLAGSRLVVQKRRACEDGGCDSRRTASSSSSSCLLCEAAHARSFTLGYLVPVQYPAFGCAGLPPQLCSTRRQDSSMHTLLRVPPEAQAVGYSSTERLRCASCYDAKPLTHTYRNRLSAFARAALVSVPHDFARTTTNRSPTALRYAVSAPWTDADSGMSTGSIPAVGMLCVR